MKLKTEILVAAFLVFYAMIHLGQYLPDLFQGKWSLVDERGYLQRLISLGADMLISFTFAFCAYYCLFRTYAQKRYALLLPALALSFILCFFVSYILAQWHAPDHLRLVKFFRTHILYDAFYSIFGMGFYFVRYAQFKELQQRELAVQKRDAELSFLRSQINPHFLFNNLNNIYSLVYHGSAQALSAISGLSELLRYMLYDTSETISLQQEVAYVEKYIALEQLRFENPCQLNFVCDTENENLQLPPLLLIPFIENAFKHGAVSFEMPWLDIQISVSEDQHLLLYCSNSYGQKRKDDTGGIGIDNVRKRLALLYPDSHKLEIEQTAHTFTVRLQLGKYSPIKTKK